MIDLPEFPPQAALIGNIRVDTGATPTSRGARCVAKSSRISPAARPSMSMTPSPQRGAPFQVSWKSGRSGVLANAAPGYLALLMPSRPTMSIYRL